MSSHANGAVCGAIVAMIGALVRTARRSCGR
jgi:hypothetical protein